MTNIIQLRQLLAEKFPGLRTHAEQLQRPRRNCWLTGIPQLDELGGLRQGGITEFVAERLGAGSTFLLCSILQQAAEKQQLSAFVDGSDSLDVTQLDPAVLSRLLWVRCRTAQEALKATDLLLR